MSETVIRILPWSSLTPEEIFRRESPQERVSDAVREILEAVRTQGDAALFQYSQQFDGATLASLEVSNAEWEAAMDAVSPEFLRVLERSAENIRAFHTPQRREGYQVERGEVLLGQRVLPIEKVGLCVPGGATPLSSTVLMDAIPAQIAGVPELVMVTPARPDGTIHPSLLASAKIAGVHRVFKLGGAQAIAALAYGTESVPKVDKIVGPGGAFVSEAKRQVFGQVAIDMIAGPSEILIVADGENNPAWLAADMLSQAEHDVRASAVLVTDSSALATAVAEELARQLETLPRQEIARTSLQNEGKIILCPDLSVAVDIANTIAPEHLELCVPDPFAMLQKIRHAGSVFLGHHTPEALGDYMAGTNHTLPTSGTARFSSPLSVDDFVRTSQYIYCPPNALHELREDIALFARQEQLEAHARSALSREA